MIPFIGNPWIKYNGYRNILKDKNHLMKQFSILGSFSESTESTDTEIFQIIVLAFHIGQERATCSKGVVILKIF